MFNPLKGLGDLNQLRKQAQEMQKALSGEEVTVDRDGVHIVMSGDQKIRELIVDNEREDRIAKAVEEALKKTQQIAASKLMQMRMSE
jgi:hypothetical protein